MITCSPRYTALCLQVAVSITQSAYTPPESFPLDPPPPYSIYSFIAQSESDDSDVFPPDPWDYTYAADSDWD